MTPQLYEAPACAAALALDKKEANALLQFFNSISVDKIEMDMGKTLFKSSNGSVVTVPLVLDANTGQ